MRVLNSYHVFIRDAADDAKFYHTISDPSAVDALQQMDIKDTSAAMECIMIL